MTEQEAHTTTCESQHQALGDELPDQSASFGAERRTDRQLTHTSGRSSQQQAGHVRAGDDQDDAHGAKEDEERLTHVTNDLLVEWLNVDSPSTVAFREAARLILTDPCEIGPRQLRSHVGIQASDRLEVMHLTVFQQVTRHIDWRKRNGFRREDPRPGSRGVIECWGHDAEHRVRRAVYARPPAHDLRIRRELLEPNRVAEHDERLTG